MFEMLDAIKEKYSDEVGLSFTFFETLTFFVYLVVSYVVFCEESGGVWGSVLTKSVDDVLLAGGSILSKARIADFLISGILTYVTIFAYKRIANLSYGYLATLKNMEEYVDRIKRKYKSESFSGQAMRLYIANTAKEQKQIHLKKLTSIKGFGLVALAIAFSSLIGLLTPNLTDLLVLIGALIVVFIVQWTAFATYTSQVVPRLVLERLARDEDVRFGEEL